MTKYVIIKDAWQDFWNAYEIISGVWGEMTYVKDSCSPSIEGCEQNLRDALNKRKKLTWKELEIN